jgi:sigma-E factor negative regulatory protein RseC
MIEQQATVITDEQGKTWLETERKSTCSQCSAKKTCGTGLLSEHVGQRFSRIASVSDESLKQGQKVNVAIPERVLLAGAFRVYLLPLFFMLAAAVLARVLFANSLIEVVAGAAGLVLGLWVAKKTTDNTELLKQIKVTEDLK